MVEIFDLPIAKRDSLQEVIAAATRKLSTMNIWTRGGDLGFCVADVRDVADLHVRAMLSPSAAGQRYIAASEWMWLSEIAELLRLNFPNYADRIPTRPMPNWILRLVALFSGDMRFVAPLIGRKHVFSADKARSTLEWQPRAAAETIIDAARSAVSIGAVKRTG